MKLIVNFEWLLPLTDTSSLEATIRNDGKIQKN